MKYGLVFAGGGTRGAYHMGVWKALNEMNIQIAAVTGASIGAIDGALFAQGEYDKARDLWKKIKLDGIVTLPDALENTENLFDFKNMGKLIKELKEKNGLDMAPLEDLLEEIIDEERIRNSETEFGFTAYSLSDMKEKNFFIKDIPHGRLSEYLMASVCLPGFRPRVIDGEKIMDGGVADNMPVDMLLGKGIRDIITVDVQGVGVYKNCNTAGVNIINIRNENPSVGTMDFDAQGIEDSINAGYFDAKKVFGSLLGEIYSFEAANYLSARRALSAGIISGLEKAAQLLGVDRFKIYTVEDLSKIVLSEFEEYTKDHAVSYDIILKGDRRAILAFAVSLLAEGGGDFAKSKPGRIGDFYDAANAVVYFRNK